MDEELDDGVGFLAMLVVEYRHTEGRDSGLGEGHVQRWYIGFDVTIGQAPHVPELGIRGGARHFGNELHLCSRLHRCPCRTGEFDAEAFDDADDQGGGGLAGGAWNLGILAGQNQVGPVDFRVDSDTLVATRLAFATELDDQLRPRNPAFQFPVGTTTLFGVFRAFNVPAGTNLQIE